MRSTLAALITSLLLVPACGGSGSDDPDAFVIADASAHPDAPETNDGRDNQCPGSAGFDQVDEVDQISFGISAVSWTAQPEATAYELARSTEPTMSDCTLFPSTNASLTETSTPPPEVTWHYLVRAVAPNAGDWGVDSGGSKRLPDCQ